jgi:hypothetical protein
MPLPRYSPKETVRRGEEWYERSIRSQVESGNHGKILMIDVDTGEYEIGDSQWEAWNKSIARNPEAQLFAMRIGFPALAKMGGGWPRPQPSNGSTQKT